MAIKVSCPSCGAGYSVKDEYAGKKFQCKKCSASVRVAEPDTDFDEFGSLSDEDDEFGQYDEFGSPPLATQAIRRSKRKPRSDEKTSRGKKEKNKGGSGPNVKLIVIAASGGGLLLIGGIILVAILIMRQANTPYARREAIEKEALALYTSAVERIEKVHGSEDAKEAADELERLADGLEDLLEREQDIPPLTRAEEDQLKEKYEPKMKALAKRAFKAILIIRGYLAREPSFIAAAKRLEAIELKAKRIHGKRYAESK